MSTPTKPKCPKCGTECNQALLSNGKPWPSLLSCPQCHDVINDFRPIRMEYSCAELTDKAEQWMKANFEERTGGYYKTLGILVHFISDHFPK